MLKETDYDFGPGIGVLKTYSIAHLRTQNIFRHYEPEQLITFLENDVYQGIDLAQRLLSRLKNFRNTRPTDRKLIEAIIMDGHWKGLGASPQFPEVSCIYWQAAALMLKKYNKDHVNEIALLAE